MTLRYRLHYYRTSSRMGLRRRIVIAFCLSWVTSSGFAADSSKSQNLAKFEAPYNGTPAPNFLRENVTLYCFSNTSGTVGFYHDVLGKKDTKVMSSLDREKSQQLKPQWKIQIDKDRASVVDDRLNTFTLQVFRNIPGRKGGLMLMQYYPDATALAMRLLMEPMVIITIDPADSSFVYTEHVMGQYGNFTTIWLGDCR